MSPSRMRCTAGMSLASRHIQRVDDVDLPRLALSAVDARLANDDLDLVDQTVEVQRLDHRQRVEQRLRIVGDVDVDALAVFQVDDEQLAADDGDEVGGAETFGGRRHGLDADADLDAAVLRLGEQGPHDVEIDVRRRRASPR